MSDTPVVELDEAENRYALLLDGEVIGSAYFTRRDSRLVFTHTEVDSSFRGRGFADILASEALGDAARRGDTIVPLCPFIAQYLRSHDVAGAVVDWPDDDDAQESATPGETPA